jgi:hypothetical protein
MCTFLHTIHQTRQDFLQMLYIDSISIYNPIFKHLRTGHQQISMNKIWYSSMPTCAASVALFFTEFSFPSLAMLV